MATTIGSAAFKLSADSAAFEADVKRATKAAERMSASLEKQIAVFGKTASEAKTYELSQRGVDAELLASISALESQKKALADQSAAVDRGKAIFDATRTAEEKYKAEISNLNGLLMRGALSFDTYNRAVKKAGENLPSVKKATEDAARAQREHDAVMQRGKAVFDSTRTAAEKYEAEVRDLNGLLKAGAINQQTHARAIDQAKTAYQKTLPVVQQTQSGFSKLTSGIGMLNSVLGAVGVSVGMYQLVGFLKDSVDAYQESIKQERKLEAVIRATGQAAGFTVAQMKDYASQRQALTGIDDDATVSAQAVLATFRNLSGDVFKDAVDAAQDMSAVLDQDMKSSALQLGKALNDPIKGYTALARAGVSFTEEQRRSIREMVKANDLLGAQKIILSEVSNEFGGAAANMRTSVQGLKADFGNLQEAIGSLFDAGSSGGDFVDALSAILREDAEFIKNMRGELEGGFDLSRMINPFERLQRAVDMAIGADALRNAEEVKAVWSDVGKAMGEVIGNAVGSRGADTGPSADAIEALEDLRAELEESIATFDMSADAVARYKLELQGISKTELEEIAILQKRIATLNEEKKAREDAAKAAEKAAKDFADEAEKVLSEQQARDERFKNEGKRVFEETRTPYEKYIEEEKRLKDLLARKAIDQDTYNRAAAKAGEDFFGMNKGEKKAEFQAPAALLAGSHGALSAINRFQGGQGGSTEEKSLEELREMKRLQAEQLKELRRRNAGLEVAKLAP